MDVKRLDRVQLTRRAFQEVQSTGCPDAVSNGMTLRAGDEAAWRDATTRVAIVCLAAYKGLKPSLDLILNN
jgi:hypothetical protein